jgi:hypothetical protein
VPSARTQRIEDLRAQLASEDLQRRGWAAWNAGEEGLVELVPLLVRELEVESCRPADWKWPSYPNALLDALVRLDARVPAQVLDPFIRSLGKYQQVPACILAARDPAANVEALAATQRSLDVEGSEFARYVLAAASPRLAALRALRDAELEVRLEVVDPGGAPPPEISNTRQPMNVAVHEAEDDPPATVYSIERSPERWEHALEGLPGSLGYRRTVHREAFELPIQRDFRQRGRQGALLLADLSGMQLAGRTTLRSTSLDFGELRGLVLPALEQQRAAWNAALRALLERGVIEPSMAQVPAPISLRCLDRRAPGGASLLNVFAPVEFSWNARLREGRGSSIELDSAEIDGLRADLESDRLERRAWAAFACGEAGLGALGMELRVSLSSLKPFARSEERNSTLLGVLDALIRLRVPAQSEDLFAWEGEGVDTELLLLAANDPARCTEFLVHCVAEPIPYRRHDLPWLAASNLLAQADPRRAVALALKDLRVTLDVHVLDDPNQPVREPSTFAQVGDARPAEISDRFPPFAYYALEIVARNPAVALQAPGPKPILGTRDPTTSGRSYFPSREYEANSYRLDTLRWLAGNPGADAALTGYVHLKQVWSTPEALIVEVRAGREELLSEWRTLLDALAKKGLLDPAKRTGALPLQLRIEDLRRDTSSPLPDLES